MSARQMPILDPAARQMAVLDPGPRQMGLIDPSPRQMPTIDPAGGPTTMQAITYHQKPTEAVDYIAPIASGTIDSATWTLIPSHATVDTFVNDDTGAQARVEAGLKYGITYRLVCKVTFVGGVSLDSEVALICDR